VRQMLRAVLDTAHKSARKIHGEPREDENGTLAICPPDAVPFITPTLRLLETGTVIHCDTEAGRVQIGLLTPAKVCGAIAPVLADMASDLIQVATFLKRNSYFQAFLLLAMAFKSAFSERRTLLNLRAELRDSSNLGYYTNRMMELLAIEQGAEAALSLVLVLYSFPYTVTGPVSLANAAVSLALSLHGLAKFRLNQELIGRLNL